ncbi:MAG: acetolactate synthase [Acidimicrobiia bacterium]|nr:acetolactate synthase [Acidimicrobiia bacterium]MYB74484.1 acetolactate synthase [Acidimicrobiia bacterium]MYH99354.1 acetolactate synthase [Acidimicrobiia bacterium]
MSGNQVTGHGGDQVLAALAPFGVKELFTLSGGHIFPLYDAAVKQGDVVLYDVRHEQTAVFAAEALAKLTRRPGVAAVTAGPGVTNSVSAVTTAWLNGAPLVVLGGRAPEARWGSGSLQELDHVPILAPVTKRSLTAGGGDDLAAATYQAVSDAMTPHRGPVFVDYPMDVLFSEGTGNVPDEPMPTGEAPDPEGVAQVADMVAAARCPALLVGTDVYWDGAWDALRAWVEAQRLPAFANGLGRGCLPADHELFFSRTRRLLRSEADLVIVAGTPLDFRLSFGRFGDAQVVHLTDSAESVSTHAQPAATVSGDLVQMLAALTDGPAPAHPSERDQWVAKLREAENAARADEEYLLTTAADPILPTRVYGELRQVLDRDAVVIGDGGDFVSYAGRFVDSYLPGHWLDPGPYGCLGTGLGYAMAARVAYPDRQVVLMLGDGAAGFSLMDADSLVRHNLPVAIVVGNNGCWGLEKHPMRQMYGYDVAADLQEGCRYDQVVSALGGAGETVERPDGIGPALKRALDAGVPYVVNVICDTEHAYPRRSNLG